MKRALIFMPMMLPKLCDQAAVQLTDILGQLLASVRHHYEPQIERWQRKQRGQYDHCDHCGQCSLDLRCRTSPALFDDEPF